VINAIFTSLAQIYKQYYYYGFWGVEITQAIMMNFCKLTSLACCFRDGAMDQSTLKRREKYYAIKTTHIPFLEYLSYMYYCGSTLCGPNFEYKDFVNFIELKENYSKIPPTI